GVPGDRCGWALDVEQRVAGGVERLEGRCARGRCGRSLVVAQRDGTCVQADRPMGFVAVAERGGPGVPGDRESGSADVSGCDPPGVAGYAGGVPDIGALGSVAVA